MPDTVICAPVRTAVGRHGSAFKGVQATALDAAVISAVVKRTGVDPGLIDGVIFGQCYPNGEAPAPSDFDRLNVNGSGISLGHPVGATGGRILATLLHELTRREQRYGLETMCIGGGQGLAALFEHVA
jgi:acetyl-CoA acetyltransferase